MKNNIRIIVYMTLILILSTLGTLGLTQKLYGKQNEPLEENKNEIMITSDKTKDSKYELLVYLNNDITCTLENCQKLIRIKTETPYAKELTTKNYANYILIYDGVIKLINVDKLEVEEVNMPYTKNNTYSINLIEESEIEIENKGKKVESITSINNNSIKYLDYSTLELKESKDYENITPFDKYYLGLNNENTIFLLNQKGEELLNLNKEITTNNIISIKENNNLLGIYYTNTRNNKTFIIYDLLGNEIIKKSGSFTNLEIGENEIYAFEEKTITVYNLSGKTIKIVKTDNYDIKYTYNNFVFAISNNNLISYNINDDVTKSITNMENKEIENITYKEYNKTGIYITLKEEETTTRIYYNLETSTIENLS